MKKKIKIKINKEKVSEKKKNKAIKMLLFYKIIMDHLRKKNLLQNAVFVFYQDIHLTDFCRLLVF